MSHCQHNSAMILPEVDNSALLTLVEDSLDMSHPLSTPPLPEVPAMVPTVVKPATQRRPSQTYSFERSAIAPGYPYNDVTAQNTVEESGADHSGLGPGGMLKKFRVPPRLKQVRKQKFSKDICEIMNLCAECHRTGGVKCKNSVVHRCDALVSEISMSLITTSTWSLSQWETLRFAADVVGFKSALALRIIEYAVRHKVDDGSIEITLKCLRNAPHQTISPEKAPPTPRSNSVPFLKPKKLKPPPLTRKTNEGQNFFPIMSPNDLHMAMEKVVHVCIANIRTRDERIELVMQDQEDQDCYYLYNLIRRLTESEVIHPDFMKRLPIEFLRNYLSYLIRYDKDEPAAREAISAQIETCVAYKSRVADFCAKELDDQSADSDPERWALITCAAFIKAEVALKVLRHEFIRGLCLSVCDSFEAREGVIYAITTMAQFGVVTEDDIQIGIERLLNRIDDLVLDKPALELQISRLIYVMLCENVIGIHAIENWIRLRMGEARGLSVLRRVLLWLERRPSQQEVDAKDCMVVEDAESVKFIQHEIARSLRHMCNREGDGLIRPVAEAVAEDIELHCNQYPTSGQVITLILISHYSLPDPFIAVCCFETLLAMRKFLYINDTVIKSAMETYLTSGPLLLPGTTGAPESLSAREMVVKALTAQLTAQTSHYAK